MYNTVIYRYTILIYLLNFQVISAKNSLHNREKRYVVFPYGGTFKFVLGFAVPVRLNSKQSLAWGWNFQCQYPLPQNYTQLENYPPTVKQKRRKRSNELSDRALVYSAIEAIFTRQKLNGKACLLQSICENANYNLHHEANGIYGHLIHVILRPNSKDDQGYLDPIYSEAQQAGLFGADCQLLYPKCNSTTTLLDLISVVDY